MSEADDENPEVIAAADGMQNKNLTIVCRPVDDAGWRGAKIKDPSKTVKKVFKRPNMDLEAGDLSIIQGIILSLLIILLIVIGYLYFKNYFLISPIANAPDANNYVNEQMDDERLNDVS